MKKIICFVVALLIFPSIAYAGSCTQKEKINMTALATNVKAGYTVVDVPIVYEDDPDYEDGERLIIDGGYSYFKIYINNLSEDFYAVISSRALKNNVTVKAEDLNEDGSYTLDIPSDKIYKKYEYTIGIYGEGTCNKTKFRTIEFYTPKYNSYYGHAMCNGIEEYTLCQQFYDYDIEYDDFVQRVNEYKSNVEKEKNKNKNEEDQTALDKLIDKVVDYKYYIIGAIVLIGVGIVIVRIVIKRRRIL